MRVWIVVDQDDGDNAATVTEVFTDLHAAKQWMLEHASEAFGHFELAAPVGWDGTDWEASFEVRGADELIDAAARDAADEEAMGADL